MNVYLGNENYHYLAFDGPAIIEFSAVDSIMDWQYVDNEKAGLSSAISLSKSNEFLIHFSGE